MFSLLVALQRRTLPLSTMQLSLPGFEGPVDAFVTMVSRHKFAAGEVPVAEVTRQCLSHLVQESTLDLELAGELMAASARLMVMKSSDLLAMPIHQEDDDLEAGSSDKSALVPFSDSISLLHEYQGRESFPLSGPPVGLAPRLEPRPSRLLLSAWSTMASRAGAARARLAVQAPSFIRLEAAISGLIRRLSQMPALSFFQMVRDSSRGDVVVHFLAVLELTRLSKIHTRQASLFGDIHVERTENAAQTNSRVG